MAICIDFAGITVYVQKLLTLESSKHTFNRE